MSRYLSTDQVRVLARILHRNDIYGHIEPQSFFVRHLMRVQEKLQKIAPSPTRVLVQAAWLHDSVEMCHCTYADLSDLGVRPHVVAILGFLTRQEGEAYGKYIERVGENRYATLVKRADLIANLSSNPPEALVMRYVRAQAYLLTREKIFAGALDKPEGRD